MAKAHIYIRTQVPGTTAQIDAIKTAYEGLCQAVEDAGVTLKATFTVEPDVVPETEPETEPAPVSTEHGV